LVTPPEVRQRFHIKVQELLGERIYLIPIYGFTEALFIGGCCPHTFADAYIQITQPGLFDVKSNNLFREKGHGKLLYTSFQREAFPFIKYSVGDIVSIKEATDCCNCNPLGKVIRFESRLPLIVKIHYGDSYFVNIVEIEKIVRQLIPGSQTLCVYGEHPERKCLFIAIFIGVKKHRIKGHAQEYKDAIVKEIIKRHVPRQKLAKYGLSWFKLKWDNLLPVFFLDVKDIPVEEGANKPKLLLDLTQVREPPSVYKKIFSLLAQRGYV